jgi:VWFA-related protein
MKRDARWLLVAGLGVVLVTGLIRGQARSTSAPQEQPALRVMTRLVEVNVIVQDKAGQPVSDLTRDDFVVVDKGRKQSIAFFSKESAATPRAPSPPLPPNVFTNRLEESAASPSSATAILLDGLNTRFADRPYARQQIVRFLGQLQPQDCVALYALGQGLRVVHDFTQDATALLAALAQEEKHLATSPTISEVEEPGVGWGEFDAWMGEVNRGVAEKYRADRALRTIRSLLAIANHLERLPGRKNLIWVAGSFPAWFNRGSVPVLEKLRSGHNNFDPEIERAARALDSAGLAIYPVDARGLVAPEEFSPDHGSISRQLPGSGSREFGAMLELAERTGGRAFYNTNDIRGAIRQAADDSRVTYVLGFYPAHSAWDGRFREINVRVKRPGLQVRHRRGYFALPEEPTEEPYRRNILDAAMWSPLNATRLGLTVRVVPVGNALELELRLEPQDITLQQQGGKWVGALDKMIVQLAPSKGNLKGVSHVVNLQMDEATYEQVKQRGVLVLTDRLEVVPGASLLRILVRDVPSGALGSVSIPLDRARAAGNR